MQRVRRVNLLYNETYADIVECLENQRLAVIARSAMLETWDNDNKWNQAKREVINMRTRSEVERRADAQARSNEKKTKRKG